MADGFARVKTKMEWVLSTCCTRSYVKEAINYNLVEYTAMPSWGIDIKISSPKLDVVGFF